MTTKRLLNAITSPARLASLLDKSRGQRPLLALEIQRKRIGMAMVWSPLGEEDVESFPDISLNNSRQTSHENLMMLTSTIRKHDVCGVLVGWPLQTYSRKMGAPCGRVLFTLESILADNSCNTPVLSAHRPFAFWTPRSTESLVTEDGWGRCTAFSKPSNKTFHRASTEQYSFNEKAQATDIWNDFWKVHWPDLYQRNEKQRSLASMPGGNTNLVADWRDTSTYLAVQAAMG